MIVEFTKAHTGKDGTSYKSGQTAELEDSAARELINQGVAKEGKGQGQQGQGQERQGQERQGQGQEQKPHDEGSNPTSRPKQ